MTPYEQLEQALATVMTGAGAATVAHGEVPEAWFAEKPLTGYRPEQLPVLHVSCIPEQKPARTRERTTGRIERDVPVTVLVLTSGQRPEVAREKVLAIAHEAETRLQRRRRTADAIDLGINTLVHDEIETHIATWKDTASMFYGVAWIQATIRRVEVIA